MISSPSAEKFDDILKKEFCSLLFIFDKSEEKGHFVEVQYRANEQDLPQTFIIDLIRRNFSEIHSEPESDQMYAIKEIIDGK